MPRLAKHPYEGYKLYKVWHRKEQRWFAVLVKTKHDRTTVAYAKYLLEVRVGKRLGKKIHAHHKDGVKTRDVTSNIKKLTHSKHNTLHNKKEKHWRICGRCSNCRKYIDKRYRGCLPRTTKRYFYCSKSCWHRIRRDLTKRQDSKGIIYYG